MGMDGDLPLGLSFIVTPNDTHPLKVRRTLISGNYDAYEKSFSFHVSHPTLRCLQADSASSDAGLLIQRPEKRLADIIRRRLMFQVTNAL